MLFKTIAKGRKGTNMVGWEKELNNDEIFETLADSKLIIDSPRREELNLLADEVKAISINEITPIEALKILNDLKKKYNS